MMNQLRQILLERIGSGGPLSFRDFMDAALYHPEHGYYRSGRKRIGREGDFFTSSHVHAAFGELVAGQIREMADPFTGRRSSFWIIEAGPGEGHLAADMMRALRPVSPGDPARFRLGLVETSPALRRVQRRSLEKAGCLEGTVWWESLDELAGEPARNGCLVANELLDALPVHRVVIRKGRLREIFVSARDGEFVETEGEPVGKEIAAYLREEKIRLEEGQQAEVNLGALEWARATARVIGNGYWIVIDYGYPARELYAPERARGTLLSYHRHRASEEFYRDVGERDLTAHLNFTALIRAAERAGWRSCGITNQMRFLISMGLLERIESIAGRADVGSVRERLALRQLIQPGGMGEQFKVLIFRRGEVSGDLRGLRDPFRAGMAGVEGTA